MTRETKIGLIVGLAFIAMFAVILSHKGAERTPGIETSFGPDSSWPTAPIEPADIAEPPARPGHRPQRPDTTVQPPRRAEEAARPAEGPARRSLAEVRQPTAQAPKASGLPKRTPELPKEAPVPGLAPRPSDKPGRPAPPKLPARPRRENRPRRSTPAQPGPQSPGEYVVRETDNLTRIARRIYGSDSPALVRAIFEANRDRLADIDTVRVGQKLVLPPWPAKTNFTAVRDFAPAAVHIRQTPPRPKSLRSGRSATGRALAAPPAKSPTRHRPNTGHQTFRYYVVKKHETYSKIAREQLGDAKRWKELAELNKDIFPDPDHIRPGVRIRLPVDALAAAECVQR